MNDMPAEYSNIDWDGLTQARKALIGNPFVTAASELDRAQAWFAKDQVVVPRAMLGLCEAQRPGDARKLALAAVHAHARAGVLPQHMKSLREAVEWARKKGLRLEPGELTRLGAALKRFQEAIERLIGVSKAMQNIRQELWTLCFGPHLYDTLENGPTLRGLNVLILGETGTGKELVAEVLQAGAFTTEEPPEISVNAAAIPHELAETELFGFEKGAHSTAVGRREGKLVAADRGTLFLDEVADLSPEVQVKLLSVIQNGKVTPLGSNEVRRVDVRYIAATSRPIHQLVKDDKFRQDLYERLAGRVIEVPPLRDRPEDIVAIGRELLDTFRSASPSSAEKDKSSNVLDALRGLSADMDATWLETEATRLLWPGNVRELERVLRQRVLGLSAQTAAPPIRLESAHGDTIDVPPNILECRASEAEVVRWYVQRVLEKTRGNQTQAMRLLGIDRSTIRRRLKG